MLWLFDLASQRLGELVRQRAYLEVKKLPGCEEFPIVDLYVRLKMD